MLKTKRKFLFLLSNSSAAKYIEGASVVKIFLNCFARNESSLKFDWPLAKILWKL